MRLTTSFGAKTRHVLDGVWGFGRSGNPETRPPGHPEPVKGRSGRARPALVAVVAAVALILALAIWAGTRPGGEHEIACYVTSLEGRTPSQIHNLVVSTKRINGMVLQPGQVFSFIKRVGPWTGDMGYEKAPVSYEGELIRSWGGGVCQTSTTLYNVALLAGLKIIERHHHHWPARYAPLGRDAAVAYSDIDLKFENTLKAPVRIVGEIRGDRLAFRLFSKCGPGSNVEIESQVRTVIRQGQVVVSPAGGDLTTKVGGDARAMTGGDLQTATHGARWKLVNRGHPGFCVATYRRFVLPSGSRRELISRDTYPPMNSVVTVARR